MSQRRPRGLAVILARLMVAVAGLLYVGMSLDWQDRIVGRGARAGQVFEVLERGVDSNGPFLLVQKETAVRIPESDLGEEYAFEPGILTTVQQPHHGLLLLGFLLFAPVVPLAAFRWLSLLRSQHFHVTYRSAFELTMVGNFLSFCLPGTISGDLARAWYSGQDSARKADAWGTIVVDRISGLSGLALTAGLFGTLFLSPADAGSLLVTAWGALAILIGVLFTLFTPLGRWLSISILLRLPFASGTVRFVEALSSYRGHRLTLVGALASSLAIHLMVACGTAAI